MRAQKNLQMRSFEVGDSCPEKQLCYSVKLDNVFFHFNFVSLVIYEFVCLFRHPLPQLPAIGNGDWDARLSRFASNLLNSRKNV
jgi:hypothetical protein